MIIPMTQDADGVWQYDDPDENDMVFELEAISGHELTSYDVLLNDVAQWAGHEKYHSHLVGLRTDLTCKFKRYFDDTEALEMAVQSYWLALLASRMQLTGTALEQNDVRRKAQPRTAAKAPRPNARNPLKAAIITAMRPHKRESQDFKTFMQMWRMGALNGLSVCTHDRDETFTITDENSDLGEQSYTWATLQKMYSQLE